MADTGEKSTSTLSQLAIDLAGAQKTAGSSSKLFLHARRASEMKLLASISVFYPALMSRFFRARLPAPKHYLAMVRLIRAARLFEMLGPIANVATISTGSPQSLAAHSSC